MTSPGEVARSARGRGLLEYALIILGCAMGALAYPLYLLPNGIAPGGVTGIATVLNHLFGLPVGMTSLVLNIPLFVLGYHAMGRRFVLRTLIATVIFSVCIDLFNIPALTNDPLLASAFGAAMLGLGLGLIMRGGATTGGTDLVAQMVHKRISAISVGVFLLAIDFLVVLLAGITMSPENAMYSMICVIICARILDRVLSGLGTDKACYIISAKTPLLVPRLLEELGRGVTILEGVGAYSRDRVQMIVCVVSRMEIMALKNIVKQEDPRAFLFITDTHETLGEGFESLGEKAH